jgi:hypothetical protein
VGGKGEGGGEEGGGGGGAGKRGEMTQTLYAHMNKSNKNLKKRKKMCVRCLS